MVNCNIIGQFCSGEYHKEIIYFSSWNIFSSLLINNIHCTLYKYTTVTQKESGRLGKKKKRKG